MYVGSGQRPSAGPMRKLRLRDGHDALPLPGGHRLQQQSRQLLLRLRRRPHQPALCSGKVKKLKSKNSSF